MFLSHFCVLSSLVFPFLVREKAIETNNPGNNERASRVERERERKRFIKRRRETERDLVLSRRKKEERYVVSFPPLLLKRLRRYPQQRGVSLRKTKINRSNHISSPEKKKKKKKKRGKQKKKKKKRKKRRQNSSPYCVRVCCVCTFTPASVCFLNECAIANLCGW